MKKNLCIIWGMLLSLGMFCACSNSDESTEVMAGKIIHNCSGEFVPDLSFILFTTI